MTKGSDEKPVRRVMLGRDGDEYVVELRRSLILVRPKGTRRDGKQEVAVGPGQIHQRLLIARIDEEKKEARKMGLKRPRKLKVKRGYQIPGK